jgi:hypothetical protein
MKPNETKERTEMKSRGNQEKLAVTRLTREYRKNKRDRKDKKDQEGQERQEGQEGQEEQEEGQEESKSVRESGACRPLIVSPGAERHEL